MFASVLRRVGLAANATARGGALRAPGVGPAGPTVPRTAEPPPMFALALRHMKPDKSVALRRGKWIYKSGRQGGQTNGVWWQPTLRALAPEVAPFLDGKGNKLKKMQQRQQQKVANNARRKEGVRRNAMFAQLDRERVQEEVRSVYRQWGDVLRQNALQRAASEPLAGDAGMLKASLAEVQRQNSNSFNRRGAMPGVGAKADE